MSNDLKRLAEAFIRVEPELANDFYFAMEETFVKKQESWRELTQIVHNWVNPKPKIYTGITIDDAEDGSGDGVLTFPEGMCEELGWKEGDTIIFTTSELGHITVSKKQQDG